MVPGKLEDQNFYRGELGGQLRVMCAIKIMESILGSNTLVVNSCDNIRYPRRASIHPEELKSRRKQADLISCLSDAFNSVDSGMVLVHVYRHHNNDKMASTSTPL